MTVIFHKIEVEAIKQKRMYIDSVFASICRLCLASNTAKLPNSGILITEISVDTGISQVKVKKTIELLTNAKVIVKMDDEFTIPVMQRYFDAKKKSNKRSLLSKKKKLLKTIALQNKTDDVKAIVFDNYSSNKLSTVPFVDSMREEGDNNTRCIHDDGSKYPNDILTKYERKCRENWWHFEANELIYLSNFDIRQRVTSKDAVESNFEYMLMRTESIDRNLDIDKYNLLLAAKVSALFGEGVDLNGFRNFNIYRAIEQRDKALSELFDLPYEVVNLINRYSHPYEDDYFGSNHDFIKTHLQHLKSIELKKLPHIADIEAMPLIINEEVLYKYSKVFNPISEGTKETIENFNEDKKNIFENPRQQTITYGTNAKSNKLKEQSELKIHEVFDSAVVEEKIQSYEHLKSIYTHDLKSLNALMQNENLTVDKFEAILKKLNKWVAGKENIYSFWGLFFTFLKKEKGNRK